MTLADEPRPSALRQWGPRAIGRAGSALPTVRGRLFALVSIALAPALVILGYDLWVAKAASKEAV
jgi:hypothetical protein